MWWRWWWWWENNKNVVAVVYSFIIKIRPSHFYCFHITVCRSDFAKKTYPKHKNWPNVPLGRITFRRKD